MTMWRQVAVVATLCLALAAPAGAVSVIGADGERVEIADSARIVAVGGSLTEIVYALGVQDRLVAVDTTSRYPEATTALPKVGYLRQLAAEPILALAPGLVLAEADAGPPTVLGQLREAGVPVLLVPGENSPDGVYAKIETVAAALDLNPAGAALIADLRVAFATIRAAVARVKERPRVLFLLSVGGGGAPMAAGADTSAASIIALAGGINAVADYKGYKPITPEATVGAAPDVILLTERSLGLLGGEDAVLRIPEIALTPAAEQRRLVAMDGLLLLGFGPRTAAAVGELSRRLHPAMAN